MALASQATPEKVAEVKDAQAKNLEAQTANQKQLKLQMNKSKLKQSSCRRTIRRGNCSSKS